MHPSAEFACCPCGRPHPPDGRPRCLSLVHQPDGPITLHFVKDGFESVKVTRTVHDSGPLRIVLTPTGIVMGQVIDAATGTPIQDFKIRLQGSHDGSEKSYPVWSDWTGKGYHFSSDDGRWRSSSDLQLPIGRKIRVKVSAAGYAPTVILATIEDPSEPASHVAQLQRGRRVEGRVVDGVTGEPLAGLKIGHQSPGHEDADLRYVFRQQSPFAEYHTRTDASGDFAFDDVLPGRTVFQVWHHGPRTSPFTSTHTIPEQGAVPDILIRIGDDRSITGVVLDHDGKPSPGKDVALIALETNGAAESDVTRTRTDGSGRFAFNGLEEGVYMLGRELVLSEPIDENQPPGEARIAEGLIVAFKDAPTLDVTLRPSGSTTLIGTLVVTDDMPSEIRVSLISLPASRPTRMPFTAPIYTTVAKNGAFRVEGLPPGTLRLEFRWMAGGENRYYRDESIDLPAEPEVHRTIRLEER